MLTYKPHLGLLEQRIYGGKYSNHQKPRILKESPLIEIYKNTRIQFENMFGLDNKTTRHSPPKMKRTFAKLMEYMAKEKANSVIPGRRTQYRIPDVMGEGINSFMMDKMRSGIDDDIIMMDAAEDGEVKDEGDLDV
jgi:hypothetical protein